MVWAGVFSSYEDDTPGGSPSGVNKYLSCAIYDTDESSIPLLPLTMAYDKFNAGPSDDKLVARSSEIGATGIDSEQSSNNAVAEYEKPPWWSYIWVSKFQRFSLTKLTISNRTMIQLEVKKSADLCRN
jgi:hypothetical protein